jgi:class 3 adenylate cyclase/tetratricopeptide (TPR) repeat protein
VTASLEAWLIERGLGDYLDLFASHHLTLADLPLLSLPDIDELGLPLGPRRRLQHALGLAPSPGASQVGRTTAPERRQVTVMFCDLVGSTELSARLDPEDYLGVLTTYQSAARAAIAQFDGYIARYLGDGLLVFFGYPVAHEDDPERAVRAALALVSAVGSVAMPMGVTVQVRLGVSTGLVVAGDIGGDAVVEDHTVLGDAPNLAARLQSEAEPGTVLISDSTLALVPGVFQTVDRGVRRLKGIAEPVHVHEVVRVTGMRSRIAAESAAGLTEFVGRAPELERILTAWRDANGGHGRAVAMFGEPGIGKSRLSHEFRVRLVGARHSWLECRGSVFDQASAFLPVTQLLDQVLGVEDGDSAERRTDLLAAGLRSSDFDLAVNLPLLTALHRLPLPDGYEFPYDTQQARRAATRDLLVEWLRRLSRSQPIVLLIDDVQWIDASTAELLDSIVRGIGDASILLLLSGRPEARMRWSDQPEVETIDLAPLDPASVHTLVENIAGGASLRPDVVDEIVRRCDGIALYAEELTRAVIDASTASVDRDEVAHTIPPTLHDPLMARLDSLGPARSLAQLGAVLGYEFHYDVLRLVWSGSEADLRDGLDRAVEQGLLYRRRTRRGELLQFRHALIRDAAYESMLLATRTSHHGRVADALQRHFPAVVDAQPETLAHHLAVAGRAAEAVRYWLLAGERANGQGAFEEAIVHLRAAIELHAQHGDSVADADTQLMLWAALGRALRVARGWAHAETGEAWERAQALCSAAVDPRRAIPIYMGLGADYLSRGDPARALALADELADLRSSRPTERSVEEQVASGYLRGAALWYLGRFREAEASLRTVSGRHSPDDAFAILDRLGVDVGPGPHSYLAWSMWALGHTDQAWELAQEVVGGRRRDGRAFTLVASLGWAGALALFRRDYAACRQYGIEAAERAGAQRIPQFVAIGTLLRLMGEDAERGTVSVVDDFTAVMAGAAGEGNLGSAPIMFSALVGLQIRAGRLDDADASIALAQSIAAHTGQRFFDSELVRLQGEIHFCRGHLDEAADAFTEALAIAEAQSSAPLQLRAATWLARTIGRDAPDDARAVVADALDGLGDGDESADVADARAVVRSLVNPSR